MSLYGTSESCYDMVWPLYRSSLSVPYVNLTGQNLRIFLNLCNALKDYEVNTETEGKHSEPMVLIGIYISIASIICIFSMALDLLHGFRNRKFWFPTKYFSLNAASITVITVAMKLPVDLSTSMPSIVDQVAKIGALAFMCTMMSNLMLSLASMDTKSLLANVTGLSILVITLIVNIFIQIRTQVIGPNTNYYVFLTPTFMMVIAYAYMGMLIFLLIILISSAITIPTLKKILEFKYQVATKTTLNDQDSQQNIVEKLRRLVKRYWIMAETGSPQFLMASTPLSTASGIICAVSMVLYIFVVWPVVTWKDFSTRSVYKCSTIIIVIAQSMGIVVGSIAPIFRCFTVLSFKSFANHNKKFFLVFKVEKYWTQKLYEWKEIRISFFPGGRRSRALLHNSKNHILQCCIGLQKIVVVSSKIVGLLPIMAIIFFSHCSNYFKSMKAIIPPSTSSSGDDTNEELSSYVLLLEGNMWLAEKTMKGISDSMNRLIQNAEKKQHNTLLKLLEECVAFEGVKTFNNDQIESLLSVQHANTWSLPIINLTCIVITLPNIRKDKVDTLFKSVGEGLLYTHLVEESLNKTSEYVNIRRATVKLWHEVEENYKWLGTSLKRNAYEGKTPTEILESFDRTSKEIVNDLNTSINGEQVEMDNFPLKLIVANSMCHITQTILHTYTSNNLEIIEDELFTRLSRMIADILAACLTNIPQVVTMRCHTTTIENRDNKKT